MAATSLGASWSSGQGDEAQAIDVQADASSLTTNGAIELTYLTYKARQRLNS